jgi:hypothetical protein
LINNKKVGSAMKQIARAKNFKIVKYGLGILFAVLIINISFRMPTGVAFGIESTSPDLRITTFPAKGFLKGDNMAPGDKVSSELTIKNEGTCDLNYTISAQNSSGDAELFQFLDLTIKDSEGNSLFAGKLKELQGLPLGVLGSGVSTVYKFMVGLSLDATNDLQGKSNSVTFVFNATEHPSTLNGRVIWDPPLEKPDAYTRSGTIMPIKFHIINNGTIDIVKRGVNLVLNGVSSDDKPVQYSFSVTDGSLDWEENGLAKPHYCLNFNAGLFPVASGSYYTAVVKYGEQILGQTQFKSGK